MILAGDVAIANGDRFIFHGFPNEICGKPWCINLEGAIADTSQIIDWGVYNASNWCESFVGFKIGPVFIGNNHIEDLLGGISATVKKLGLLSIQGFGAGINKQEASQPAFVSSGCHDYVLVGFGWPVIGCRPATLHRAGINRLDEQHILRTVATLFKRYPSHRIVVVMHWNYEFERYPQPGHRKLAMDLIDQGVYAVVGHHPHIIGPVERYKGRTIAYSLGNWAFSYGRFFHSKLRFPESSFSQIALEFGEHDDVIHHAQFFPPYDISYCSSEHVNDADFSLKPIFEGMAHQDYASWFKMHRLKKLALPIYLTADDTTFNQIKNTWVAFRQVVINVVVKMGLKQLQRKG